MTRSKTHTTIRVTAAAVLAFYALATGRALIPGLCSTLAAVEEGVHAANSGAVCCPVGNTADGPVIHALPETHAACAFCALCKALCVPITSVSLDPANTLAAFEPLDYVEPYVAHDDAPAISRRGPPSRI